jgi:hypothetical protein
LALVDVDEDTLKLYDVVDICFNLVLPVLDFVFVACDLETFFPCIQSDMSAAGCSGGAVLPFFMRTKARLVSLIWFEGVFIPTGIAASL